MPRYVDGAIHKPLLRPARGDSSRVGANRLGPGPQVNFQYDLGLWKDEASSFMIHILYCCFPHKISLPLTRQHVMRITASSFETPDNML